MPSKLATLEFPDHLLTAGDLVGRAVRIGRTNWLGLGRFFLVPTFFYWMSIPCAFWDPETYANQFSPAVNFWIIATGWILIFLSIWEISVRKYALICYLAGAAASIEEGLQKAQKKMWTVLILTIPVFLFEIFENLLSVLTTKLSHVSESASHSDVFTFWELWLSGLEFALLLPFLWVIMLNSYYMACVIFENVSLIKATKRYLSLSFQDAWYITLALILMSFVYFCVGGPVIGLLSFQFMLPRDALWYFVSGIGSAMLAAPLDGFMSAVITICGALLYKQVCARREGKDLLEKLQLLRAE